MLIKAINGNIVGFTENSKIVIVKKYNLKQSKKDVLVYYI